MKRWQPGEREKVIKLWQEGQDWTLTRFVDELQKQGIDRSIGSVWFILREYVRDGFLDGNWLTLNRESMELQERRRFHADPNDNRSKNMSRLDLWLRDLLREHPQGIQKSLLTQLARDQNFSPDMLYRAYKRLGVRISNIDAGHYLVTLEENGQPKKRKSRPEDTAVILERYRAGKIDLELALELLGKR